MSLQGEGNWSVKKNGSPVLEENPSAPSNKLRGVFVFCRKRWDGKVTSHSIYQIGKSMKAQDLGGLRRQHALGHDCVPSFVVRHYQENFISKNILSGSVALTHGGQSN